ncbi:MAG: hypothetical protein Q4B73_02935 [Lachnospiraceae bacterium]|nr:hypothetical protein [Lachnospiraceae bacterium]
MADTRKIPIHLGYTEKLRFRLAPINKDIMAANADYLTEAELCLDGRAAEALILPFIQQHLKKPFQDHDEINLMSFASAKRLCRDLKTTVTMLKEHFDDPNLNDLKNQVTLDMIVREDDLVEFEDASPAEIRAFIKANFSIVTDFYTRTIREIVTLINRYEAQGYRHFAISYNN